MDTYSMIARFTGRLLIGYDEGPIGTVYDLPQECQIFDGDHWNGASEWEDDPEDVRIGVARNLEYIGDSEDTQYIRAEITVQEQYKNCEFEIYLTPSTGIYIYAYDDS